MGRRVCSKCHLEKDLEEFYSDKTRPKSKSYICKECSSDKGKKYYQNNSEKGKLRSQMNHQKRYRIKRRAWSKWLIDNKYDTCVKCGYSNHLAAIEYHHRNPEEKKTEIGYLFNRAFNAENQKIIEEELKKCDVLCANCHRIVHSKYFD